MNRLLVSLLAAFDAILAVAVGLVAALAPLTLLWVFGFGDDAAWSALWAASGRVWQVGNLVPLTIALPVEYTTPVGIDPAAATFVFSLAPLAFAAFTAVFAARSGARAASAGAGFTGALVGSVVFAVAATGIALTTGNDIATIELWQAILAPALVFALPAFAGALVVSWRDGDDGVIDTLRGRLDQHGVWTDVPGLVVRGSAIVVVGLIGLGALAVGVAIALGGAQIIALFQAGQVDLLGASVLALIQLAYLPTLFVWGLSFVAGPGFALGEGTIVAPAGTQVGVIPGIPVLGALPESTSPWMLLLALLPVALGALAGWVARSNLVRHGFTDASGHEPMGARLVVTAGIAVVSGAVAALLAFAAAGALGPGSLAVVGPEPGPVALAVGVEVLVGAAILLLMPRRPDEHEPRPNHDVRAVLQLDTGDSASAGRSEPQLPVLVRSPDADGGPDAGAPSRPGATERSASSESAADDPPR